MLRIAYNDLLIINAEVLADHRLCLVVLASLTRLHDNALIYNLWSLLPMNVIDRFIQSL
jgi:hypothetical protein